SVLRLRIRPRCLASYENEKKLLVSEEQRLCRKQWRESVPLRAIIVPSGNIPPFFADKICALPAKFCGLGHLRRTLRDTNTLGEIVLLEFIPQGSLTNVQHARCLGLVSASLLQSLDNQGSLDTFDCRTERKLLVMRWRDGRQSRFTGGNDFLREVLHLDVRPPTEHKRTLNHILQFADISRPRVGL